MITGAYCENSCERLAQRNGYRGISIVLAENRDGLEVRRQLPRRPASRKVLRNPEEPLIGRVSATEYFRGAFAQKGSSKRYRIVFAFSVCPNRVGCRIAPSPVSSMGQRLSVRQSTMPQLHNKPLLRPFLPRLHILDRHNCRWRTVQVLFSR